MLQSEKNFLQRLQKLFSSLDLFTKSAIGVVVVLLLLTPLLVEGPHLITQFAATPQATPATSTITTPLKASSTNSHYFVDGNGNAVLLAGSHTWNDFQDEDQSTSPAPFDFTSYVSFLTSHGMNNTILWHKDLPTFCNWGAGGTWHIAQFPWLRTGPGTTTDGKPKFDLTQFDQSYFDRLRARVVQLQQNNIYATVELFDGLGLVNNRCGSYPYTDGYPFTGANNINGIDDGGGTGSMTMTAANAITNIQDAYVKKVIDTVGDLPNVLWEISEEAPSNSTWWEDHMISLIHTYEAGKPLQHPVGYPCMQTLNTDSITFGSAADWVAPCAKISPTNNQGKVVINDSDHSYFGMWNDSAQTNRNYIWENVTNGSSVIFMDPYEIYWSSGSRNLCPNPVNGVCSGVDTRWDNFRNNLGYAVSYGQKMNLLAMSPQGNRSSTGYALANTSATGSEFLVYAPNGGSFTVNLSNTIHNLSVEWLNPSNGQTTQSGTVAGGSTSQSFTPPFSGDAVLYLKDTGSGPTTTPVPTSTPGPSPSPTQTPTPTQVPSPMPTLFPGAPNLVQSVPLDTTGTSATVTYANAVQSGNLLVAAIRIGNNSAIGTVTDTNGNAWTLAGRKSDNGSGNGDDLELWYAANAKVLPNAKPTLTISSSVSATIRAIVEEYSGIATVSPLDQVVLTNGSSSQAQVLSGVTTQAIELGIGFSESDNPVTYTQNPQYTLDTTVASKLASEYRVLTAAGAQTVTFSLNASVNWAMGITTFRASGTTPTPTLTPIQVPGDANGDGKVDLSDLSILASQWQKTGSGLSADFNHDNIVDLTDFSILAGHWNG